MLWRAAGDTIQTKSAIGVLLAQRLRAEFKEPIGIIQVTLAVDADKLCGLTPRPHRGGGNAVGDGQWPPHRLPRGCWCWIDCPVWPSPDPCLATSATMSSGFTLRMTVCLMVIIGCKPSSQRGSELLLPRRAPTAGRRSRTGCRRT
jgi:hypothetical protein